MIFTAFLLGVQLEERQCKEKVGKFACCVLVKETKLDSFIFIWQIGGGAEQFYPSCWSSLTRYLKTEKEQKFKVGCSKSTFYDTHTMKPASIDF